MNQKLVYISAFRRVCLIFQIGIWIAQGARYMMNTHLWHIYSYIILIYIYSFVWLACITCMVSILKYTVFNQRVQVKKAHCARLVIWTSNHVVCYQWKYFGNIPKLHWNSKAESLSNPKMSDIELKGQHDQSSYVVTELFQHTFGRHTHTPARAPAPLPTGYDVCCRRRFIIESNDVRLHAP